MPLRFTKMHGLGNDFVVVDAIRQSFHPDPSLIRRLADRRRGVGCDQVLLVERAPSAQADFGYRIFNADGDEVEQCGNGARCFLLFVREQGLTQAARVRAQTASGVIEIALAQDAQFTVDMGAPRFEPREIPFDAARREPVYTLDVDGRAVTAAVLSMGNPHAVLRVDDVARAPVATLGPAIERHARFPRRVNVGFMQVLDRTHVRLRVYERGAGETQACGSGACAAVVAGRVQGWLDETVEVALPGGALRVRWAGEGARVQMTGPATRVFEGSIDLERL